MRFAHTFEKAFRWLLPSPFAIALGLTFMAAAIAWLFGAFSPGTAGLTQLAQAWQSGLWNPPLLVFMVQMLLILVLGHALALSPAVNSLINRLLTLSSSVALSTALVCFFTLLVSLFNWGLGLVFGAILARKTAERLAANQQPFNYGLLGAAGYSGLMVWHGGISGSAPIKVAEAGHLQQLAQNHLGANYAATLPNTLGFEETIFSTMNLSASLILLLSLPLLTYLLALNVPVKKQSLKPAKNLSAIKRSFYGAEKIDHSFWGGLLVGGLFLSVALYLALSADGLQFINPNFINLSLLALALIFHGSLYNFSEAIDKAIGGAAGIVTQFPLYFGIMGIMAGSGLVAALSEYFSSNATAASFPIFTFFSAGLINIFVPSGGGQWAIQGPVLIQTAQNLGIPLGKTVMALAYGDQLTNMLQPFWALPLLGITGLKAREIVPYTVLYLLLGVLIFVSILLLF
jgi:short-chain fatty acids transporter